MKKLLVIALSFCSLVTMAALPARAQTNVSVVTAGASNITQTTAVLNGSYAVNVGGDRADRPTTFFQYGPTTAFGFATPSRSHSRFNDQLSVEVSGLNPNTQYFVRAVAQNRAGIVYGPTVSFNTLPDPNATTVGGTGGTNVTIMEQPGGNPGTGTGGGSGTAGGTGDGGSTGGGDGTTSGGGDTNTGDSDTTTGAAADPGYIGLDIDDDRETFTVGDILTYEVEYENISDVEVEDVFIRVELPDNTEFLSAGEGVYLRKEHAVVFDLGDLDIGEDGDVNTNVRAVTALREGTRVAATAVLLYTNPSNGTQASAVHYDINEYDSDGQAAGTADGKGFGGSVLAWLIILVLLLVIALIGRKIYLRYKEQKEQEQAELELQDVLRKDMDDDIDPTMDAIQKAPQSIDDLEPQMGSEEGEKDEYDDLPDPWADEEESGVSSEESGEPEKTQAEKEKDFLDNLPS